MATQSSSSARGDSEQKVPSVRKGGRGGGGNRNSGGGPGHSGHSVLSSVSSSSILHLSVLKKSEETSSISPIDVNPLIEIAEEEDWKRVITPRNRLLADVDLKQ